MRPPPEPPPGLPADVAAELLARWQEPHRGHHGLRHLGDVLAAVHELAEAEDDTAQVLLAAWFHDAVYAGRPDDEERSAELARDRLTATGTDPVLVAEVVRLVLLTRDHAPASGDRPGALLCDADLSVLGASPARYAEYVDGVRTEWAHLDDASWRRGRADVLQRLLALDPLFRTDAGRARWETAARINLGGELRDLSP